MEEQDLLTFERLRDIRKNERNSDTLTELEEDFFKKAEDYLDRKRRIGDENSSEYRTAKHMVEDIIDTRAKKIMKLAFLSTKTKIPAKNLLEDEKELFQKLKENLKKHQENLRANMEAQESDDESEEVKEDSDSSKESFKEEIETVKGSEESSGKQVDGEEEETEQEEKVSSDSEKDDALEPGKDDSEPDSGENNGGEVLFDASLSKGSEEPEDSSKEEESVDSSEGDKVKVMFLEDVEEFVGPELNNYGPFKEGDEEKVERDVADLLDRQDKVKVVK